jgi:hypothetical protein
MSYVSLCSHAQGLVKKHNNLLNRPYVIAQASSYSRGSFQGLMHAPEVVVHVEQRDLVHVVVNLFAEAVRQASEPAHVHSHGEILSFYVTGTHVLWIGVTDDFHAFGSQTLRGAVALLSLRIVAEDLNQLREVNGVAECIRNSSEIHLVPIRRQLDSVRQPACNILKKIRRTPRVPPTYEPTNHQVGIGVNRRERPNITRVASAFPNLRSHIFGLGIAETPNLIDLDALRGDIAKRAVLILSARRTDLFEQPENCALRHARHARGRTNRAAFDKGRNDRCFLRDAEYVCHDLIIPYRSGMSRAKRNQAQLLFRCFLPPSFLGCELPHLTTLFWREKFHAMFAACFTALSAHGRHDLGNERAADGDLFILSHGFQNDPAGILNYIKLSSSAFWHTPLACHGYNGGVKRGFVDFMNQSSFSESRPLPNLA